MTRTERFALSCLCLVALTGCRGSRVIEVQGEAPPPTVQTETARVVVDLPAPAIEPLEVRLRALPAVGTPAAETRPERVVVYAEPRPDTSRAFGLWALRIDPSRVEVSGAGADYAFVSPVDGETLHIQGISFDSLRAIVEGEPVTPPVQRFECPAPPDPGPFGRGLAAYVKVFLFGAFCAGLGVVVCSLINAARLRL